MPSKRGMVSLLALSCLLTGPLGDLRPAFAVASPPSPLSVAGEVSPPMGAFAGIADIQRWLDGPPLSSASRDALRTMTQRNPGISDALVEAFTEEAKRFKSKPEAISLARRWTRAGTMGLIADTDRDRIGQMIAKRAADQNQRGSIPWMLTDEHAQIPGLDTAAAETLIARRTLKHAVASQSPEAADRKRAEEQRAAEQRAREEADRKRAEEQRAQERRGREEIERKRAEDQRAAEWRAKVEAERKRAEDQRAAEQRAKVK